MWSLQAVSAVWVASRICVLRMTGRLQGTMADEYAWWVPNTRGAAGVFLIFLV